MRMNRLHSIGLAALAALALAGCGSSVKLDQAPIESRTATPVAPREAGSDNAGTAGAGNAAGAGSGVTTVDADAAARAAKDGVGRVVYFDYDSFVVRDEFRPLIEANAKALAANRSQRLVLEGHADARGGREYNLALGQKRADAVLKSLRLLGAAETQLEAVSFGSERPAVEGNDEAAWAKNRRVELKDR